MLETQYQVLKYTRYYDTTANSGYLSGTVDIHFKSFRANVEEYKKWVELESNEVDEAKVKEITFKVE